MVSEKLRRGVLPAGGLRNDVRVTEPRRETPRACAACDEPLAAGDTVYEIEAGPVRVALHAECHAVWQTERVAALTEPMAYPEAVEAAWALRDVVNDIGYVVDASDRLVACSREAWRRFAVDNDGVDVAEPDRLLQRSLFEFIGGEQTRRLYQAVHQHLKAHPDARVVLTGRCDAPAVRRAWRVSMTALVKGDRLVAIVYRSTILAEVRRRREVTLLRRDRVASGPGALSMCSLCLKVRPVIAAEWLELEEHAANHPEGREKVLERTVCTPCERDVVGPALAAA